MKTPAFRWIALSLLAIAPLHGQTRWSAVSLAPPGATYSVAYAFDGSRQVGVAQTAVGYEAAIWSGSAGSLLNLTPSGATVAVIHGARNGQQVGWSGNGTAHATTWVGTAASATDLNPAGASNSYLLNTTGSQQVGYAGIGGEDHAGLWAGTAGTFIDLNPAGATESIANATNGSRQVGYAATGATAHAALWAGSAANYTDLNPLGASASVANAIADSQSAQDLEAGYATIGGNAHAGVWRGTAGSFTDLNPAGATSSSLTGTTTAAQVGSARFGGVDHAGYWSGTAASFVDLHGFLGGNYSSSNASAIWSDGTSTFVVGEATNSTTGHQEAVLWKLSPAIAPTVLVKGPKTKFQFAAKDTLKGTAADADGDLSFVEVKVGAKAYRHASGLEHWKFIAHLKFGRNKILVRAVDAEGLTSAARKVTVTRL